MEHLGASLLDEVREERLQELLKSLRHTLHPQPRDVLGFGRIDRLLELFRYPSGPSGADIETGLGGLEPELLDDDDDDTRPETRPAIIHLTSPSSPSSLQSSPGKTSLLYLLTALCLLPPAHGGKGSSAVWIDTDARFSIHRLSRIMASVLSGRAHVQDQDQAQTTSIISSAVAHLHVIKPATSAALLASLDQLPAHLLRSSSTSHGRALGLVVLDSVNAFYHQDRLASELARLSSSTTAAAAAAAAATIPPPASESIIAALKAVQSTFDCTIAFSTTPHPTSAVSSASNNEVTTSVWASFATLTLHLARLPVPKFPHSMALEDCLRDRVRRQQAVAKGRVRVYVDMDAADPSSRAKLRRSMPSGFVIRLGVDGVDVDDNENEA